MSKTLPAGWEEKTLGEVCSILNGLWTGKKEPFCEARVLRNTNFTKDCKLDLSDIACLQVEQRQFASRELKKGDLLLEKSGGGPKQPVGRIVLFDKDEKGFSFSNFTSVLRVKDQKSITPYFLHYFLYCCYLSGVTIPMQKHTTGIRNLQMGEYKNIVIPIPPLSEQKRIVEKLDKIFANIDKAKENTKKNLQNAKEVFNSALIEAFIIHNAVESYLKDICIKKQNKNWKDENDNAVYYYIDLSSVDRNTNSIGEVQKINKENAPSRAQQIIKADDVLFGTTRPTLKRLCIVPNEFDNHICSTGFCVLRADLKKVIPVFLFYALSHPSFYEYIEPLQRGASYPAVTDKDVLNFKIPLPSLEEQKKIVAQLDALRAKTQELEQIYTKKLADLDELKQSILQQAFSGKL